MNTIAWLVTSAFGFVTGAEIANAFNASLPVIIIAGLFGMIIIGIIDLFVINLKNSAMAAIARVLFSIALVGMSIFFALSFLFRADIENEVINLNSSEIDQLDSIYFEGKNKRYEELLESKAQTADYHKKVCQPEALKIRKGPIFELKHRACINDSIRHANIEQKLDLEENPFFQKYEKERNRHTSKVAGLGRRGEILWQLLTDDLVKMLIGICFLLMIFVIDTLALTAKFSVPKENKYEQLATENSQLKSAKLREKINRAIELEDRREELDQKMEEIAIELQEKSLETQLKNMRSGYEKVNNRDENDGNKNSGDADTQSNVKKLKNIS